MLLLLLSNILCVKHFSCTTLKTALRGNLGLIFFLFCAFFFLVVWGFLNEPQRNKLNPYKVMPYISRTFLSKQEDKKHMSERKIRTHIKRLNWGLIKASLVHKHYWHIPLFFTLSHYSHMYHSLFNHRKYIFNSLIMIYCLLA